MGVSVPEPIPGRGGWVLVIMGRGLGEARPAVGESKTLPVADGVVRTKPGNKGVTRRIAAGEGVALYRGVVNLPIYFHNKIPSKTNRANKSKIPKQRPMR